ncbi:MAG: tryptophanyl-tRNA synthetase [Thermoplasmata archaeon]|jgi:tryptophanyl-tRNA synthetase|nr:tryptophanyl-tRNA synthetase [Thermoplasmata archaeon]
MRIDPWASQQSTDYARLRSEFGIQPFDPELLPEPSPLMQRGVIFGQRGFEPVARAVRRAEPFGVLTGLMPSGPMHFGHKLVMDQVTYYQKLGADVTITVADIEAYATRNMSLEKAREYAFRYYIPYYLALGLDIKTASLYFQSQRQAVKDLSWKLGRKVNWSTMEAIYGFGGSTNMGHAVAPLVQVGDILHVQMPERGGPRPIVVPVGVDQDPHVRLTRDLAVANRLLNLQPEGLVTVSDSQNEGAMAALFAALRDAVERAAQTEGFRASETSREFYKEWRKESERAAKSPTRENHLKAILLAARGLALEPLGFDRRAVTPNAPHGVMTIGGFTPDVVPDVDQALAKVEQQAGGFGFLPPAATYHRFMQGLQGGKMSSSKPESHISLEDTPEEAAKKMGSALTGGRETAEEQRRLGGRAEECMVYETYVYHLVPDAKELGKLYDDCKSGKMLCGECKGIAKEKVRAFMKDLQEKKAEREHLVKELVRAD